MRRPHCYLPWLTVILVLAAACDASDPAPTAPAPTARAPSRVETALSRLPLQEQVSGSYYVVLLDELKRIPEVAELFEDPGSIYRRLAESIQLPFAKVTTVAFANHQGARVWVFEGPFTDLDIQDVRLRMAEHGYRGDPYGDSELWHGGRQIGDWNALLIADGFIVAGADRSVRHVARVIGGEEPSSLADPATVYALPRLRESPQYRFLSGGSWPGGRAWLVSRDEDGNLEVAIEEQVMNPRSRFDGEYSPDEVLAAMTRDGYSGGLVGDMYQFTRTVQADDGAEAFVLIR